MSNGMKQTKIGEIPQNWQICVLGECAIIKGRLGWKGLKQSEYVPDGPYMIAGKHISNGKINWDKCDHIPEARYEESIEIALEIGDVIFSKDGSLGNPALISHLPGKATINSTMMLIRAETKVNSNFLYQILQSAFFKELIRERVSGSSIPHIFQKDMHDFKFPLPPLPEQQKIAKILSTVDEKIALIDEQLAKTIELKTGLMQRLLTKGIGHTEFKDSTLGDIPKVWEVDLLDNVTKRGSGHTPSKSFPEYYNGGIKWISLADSNRLDKGWIKDSKYNISNLGIKNSSAVLHPKGTVLLSRDAGVGKSAVMYEDMAVSQHFITWTCGPKINNWFLYYYLQAQKPYFERVAAGSTIKTIGLPLFKKLAIPVPPRSEQDQIAEIIITVDDKIQVLQDKKAYYQTLKRGLMQQLLTGKLRVRVVEDTVPA